MKQTINIGINFQGRSCGVKIDSVYQINGSLIAVAHITQASRRGEILTLKSSITVKTNSEAKLPVKFYIVNNTGQTIPGNQNFTEVVRFESIREIAHLQPLPIAKPLSAQYAGLLLAAKTAHEENSTHWERELDSFPIEVQPTEPNPEEIEEDEPIWCAPM